MVADDDYRAETRDAVPYWLLIFLNNTPPGYKIGGAASSANLSG